MSLKNVLTASLLMFVAASIVVLTVRALRINEVGAGGAASAQDRRSSSAAVTDGLIVYYLHGKERCPTCTAMEASTREAIESRFGEELQRGAMAVCEINYDEPGNEHYVHEYEIPTPSPAVVLQKVEGGNQQQWKNLDRAFELAATSSKASLIEYIQEETRAMLTAR